MAGAMMTLLIAVPAAVFSEWMSDDDGSNESNWVLLAGLVVVIAYLFGGALAGRAEASAPFLNGAAATFLAWGIVQTVGVVLRLGRGDDVNLIGLVFNGLLAASIGILGAWIGARWAARYPHPLQPEDPLA